MRRVGDELPHALLRRRPGGEGTLDLGEHRVERRGQAPDLGLLVVLGHPAGEVPGGDGRGGVLDLGERPQAGPYGGDTHGGQDDEYANPDQHLHHDQAVDRPVSGGEVLAEHQHVAVAERGQQYPPALVRTGDHRVRHRHPTGDHGRGRQGRQVGLGPLLATRVAPVQLAVRAQATGRSHVLTRQDELGALPEGLVGGGVRHRAELPVDPVEEVPA